MRTRSQSRNLHHQQQQTPPPVVKPFNLEEPIENPAPPLAPMDDTRTMAQLLEAPTAGYKVPSLCPKSPRTTLSLSTVSTTGSGIAYKDHAFLLLFSLKVWIVRPEITMDMMPPANTKARRVQPPVVPVVHHDINRLCRKCSS
ncbi:hypothetical protein Tco_0223868 [Tanacetum coccineum]